jgi:hypothetical protein
MMETRLGEAQLTSGQSLGCHGQSGCACCRGSIPVALPPRECGANEGIEKWVRNQGLRFKFRMKLAA